MKIGFFCNEYPPRSHGGIGTFVREIAEALAQRGHSVTVVEFGDQVGEHRQNDVRVVTLPESRTRRVAWFLNRWRLHRWIKRSARSGEVEVFEIPEFQGWLPFPREPCPIIVRLHLAESHINWIMDGSNHKGIVFWLEKATLSFHRCWIGVSRYILEAEQRFFCCCPDLSRVIYNPVPKIGRETENKAVSFTPPRYFLYVGSVSERKGALALARAAKKLLYETDDLHLVYIGRETNYDAAPISVAIWRIVGEPLDRRILFTGPLSHEQTLRWMQSAVAIVLPSQVEAFGLVPVEAMSLGVPVIYSKTGPGPELITDGVDGLLVDPKDIAGLQHHMEILLREPEYAKRLGNSGRQTVEQRFSIDRCVSETLTFYEEVMTKWQEDRRK